MKEYLGPNSLEELSGLIKNDIQNSSSTGDESSKPGEPGKDGFSPVVEVSEIDGGHEVTITDAEGEKSFAVMDGLNGANGKDGKDGADGENGFSPTVQILEISDGHRLTITDSTGAKSFDVFDGKDGREGQQGIQGVQGIEGQRGEAGANGQDGFSPTVSVTEIEGGHRIVITDADGPKTFDVMDGVSGSQNQTTTHLVNAPIGSIIPWHGTEDTIPEGWHVCDGNDGTYDLRGKFMLGASDVHPVGETGGSEEVTLTVEQMPKHDHKYTLCYKNTGSYTALSQKSNGGDGFNYNITGIAGGSEAHSNMPPYLALIFIQKIGVTPTDYVTEKRVEEKVSEALENVQSGEVYSTEETRIGTWIDGKPLYRKVFDVILPIANASSSVEILKYDANIERVVRLYGVATIQKQASPIPHYFNSEYYVNIYYNTPSMASNPKTLRAQVGLKAASSPAIIFLEYTKSTDESATIELSPSERAVFVAAKAAEHAIPTTSTITSEIATDLF